MAICTRLVVGCRGGRATSVGVELLWVLRSKWHGQISFHMEDTKARNHFTSECEQHANNRPSTAAALRLLLYARGPLAGEDAACKQRHKNKHLGGGRTHSSKIPSPYSGINNNRRFTRLPGYVNLGSLVVCSIPARSLIRPARSGVAAPPATRLDQPTATPPARSPLLWTATEDLTACCFRMIVEMKRKISRSRDRLSRISMRTRNVRLTTFISRGEAL